MSPVSDDLLAGAISRPLAGISDVLGVLESIDAALPDSDGLKWFNWLYWNVTRAVGVGSQSVNLQDPKFIAALDVNFASLYFAALRSSMAGGSPLDCWRALFERRFNAGIARIQFAIAGINAHINHDLPAAIAATCLQLGCSPVHGDAHYQDYTNLNSTLDQVIDAAKSELHVGLLGQALPPVSHVEDAVAAWKVAAAREAAWTSSEVLWSLHPGSPFANRYLGALDGLTAVASKALLAPVLPAGPLGD
jgi:hypothetical protein